MTNIWIAYGTISKLVKHLVYIWRSTHSPTQAPCVQVDLNVNLINKGWTLTMIRIRRKSKSKEKNYWRRFASLGSLVVLIGKCMHSQWVTQVLPTNGGCKENMAFTFANRKINLTYFGLREVSCNTYNIYWNHEKSCSKGITIQWQLNSLCFQSKN